MERVKCSKCGGTGKVTCPTCGGTGYIISSGGIERGPERGFENRPERVCPTCGGAKKINCPSCNGTGYIEK